MKAIMFIIWLFILFIYPPLAVIILLIVGAGKLFLS